MQFQDTFKPLSQLVNSVTRALKWTHRGKELRSGDGRTVTVQLDAAAQVKVTDLHRGNLRTDNMELLVTQNTFISKVHFTYIQFLITW